MAAETGEHGHASKLTVRIWAWALGALSFLAPLALLGLSPKPVLAEGGATPAQSRAAKPKRPVIIIVTKKIIHDPAPAPVVSSGGGGVSYVYAPSSGGSSAPTSTASAPAAPAAVSCGSHC